MATFLSSFVVDVGKGAGAVAPFRAGAAFSACLFQKGIPSPPVEARRAHRANR